MEYPSFALQSSVSREESISLSPILLSPFPQQSSNIRACNLLLLRCDFGVRDVSSRISFFPIDASSFLFTSHGDSMLEHDNVILNV